jgi:hypothetical protein
MIGAVVRDVEKHLPYDQVFVFFWLFDWLIEKYYSTSVRIQSKFMLFIRYPNGIVFLRWLV